MVRGGGGGGGDTRRAQRKAKRQLKKAQRHRHYSAGRAERAGAGGRFVRAPPPAQAPDPQLAAGHIKKSKKDTPSAQDLANAERVREKLKENKLQKEMEEQRRKMLLKANEDEDKMIKKLEKQLGLKKKKNKNSLFADDGLDYLLDVCDRSTQEQLVAAKKHLADVDAESDFEDDLATVTGKPSKKELKTPKNEKSEKSKELEDDDDEASTDEEMDSDDHIKSTDDQIESEDDLRSIDSEVNCDDEIRSVDDEMRSVDDEMESDNEMRSIDDELSSMDGSESRDESTHDGDNKHPAKRRKDNKQNPTNNKKQTKHRNQELDLEKDKFNEDFGTDEENENVHNNDNNKMEKPDIWEDIYGRKRDKEGNIIKEEKGAYVPPHLRNKEKSSESLEMLQLKRQIKGVLNKLAGTNLHWACTTLEALYNKNSRNAVNTALSDLWIEATVQVAVTPDRMIAEHAALVSVLQANVGIEVGAHFLQVLAKRFEEMLRTEQPSDSKKLENLTAVLAYLYNFKIYHASLLYEMLKRLLSELSERRVSCVLRALRAVGGTLRRDEPAALKTFIHDTQAAVAELSQSAAVGSRIKFLLEVLMAVKNNNLTKIPNYDPEYSDDLKKATKGIVRRGNYVTALNIGLDDLLRAEDRGKWWVVGSAWEGTDREKKRTNDKKDVPDFDQKLLELARKQRMNTDVRRSIFCIIMSAEDYMDAFEKLQRLGLKNQQERETVHVLLACCLQEKTYNPYYAVLATKLAEYDRRLQLSIQYTLWDKIKDLESLSKGQISNLGRFITHLIMEKGLPLSVLKVIEFSDLSKRTVRFMRQILLAIIMNDSLQATLEVFQRISSGPKLNMFRESLRLFIQHFLIKNAQKGTNILSESEMQTLKERTQRVEKILCVNDSKSRM